jgi:RNA polymerase sigma-70 factor (ECF subfamily)
MTPPPHHGSALEAPVDEDKRLVLAFKSGHLDSYDAIYARHSDAVRRVCRRMLVNQQDADEAFQETFLKVYRALGRFNGRYQLGAWITRIATNVCLDQIRSRARHPVKMVEPEWLDVDAESAVVLEDADPESQVIKRQESRHVRRVLEQLPPKHRAAIILRDFECLSYAEVAEALDITECQTKALIHRARKSFKRSWTAPLAALLPWRWAQKVRRLELADQPVQWVPASQAVASCSSVMQQCGQFVLERVAPVATAALITGATGVALTQPAPQGTLPDHTSVEAREQESVVLSRALVRRAETKKSDLKDPTATEPPSDVVEETPEDSVPPEEPVVPEPEPTTEPEPESPPQEEAPPPAEPTPIPEPAAPPPPSGFAMSVALIAPTAADSCTCSEPNGASKSYVGITSAGIQSFDQTLHGTVTADGHQYGVWVRHSSNSSDTHGMEFRLSTADGGHFYSASGTITEKSMTEWNGWSYSYEGSYRLTSRPGGANGMPTSGTYTITVMASWEQNRIVATDIVFH